MTAKMMTLEAWAAAQFGDDAPNADTLRRWARKAYISPAPVKHGRTYFVARDAVYVHPEPQEPANDDAPPGARRVRLVDRVKRDKAA